LSSVASTAFTATVIYFDSDTADAKRHTDGWFYGINRTDVQWRTAAMFFMNLGFSAAHVTSKSIACALMWRISPLLLVGALVGELTLFLLYKFARGDMRHWIGVPLPIFILMRVISKGISDFTLVLLFRHQVRPGEASEEGELAMCGRAHARQCSCGRAICGRARVQPSACASAAERIRGRAHLRPSAYAAERIRGRAHLRPSAYTCGRAHVQPSACASAAERTCVRAHLRPSARAAERV
jgi:hypothetical protein